MYPTMTTATLGFCPDRASGRLALLKCTDSRYCIMDPNQKHMIASLAAGKASDYLLAKHQNMFLQD